MVQNSPCKKDVQWGLHPTPVPQPSHPVHICKVNQCSQFLVLLPHTRADTPASFPLSIFWLKYYSTLRTLLRLLSQKFGNTERSGFLQLHLTATEFMLNIFRKVFLLGSRHGKWSLNWVLICLGASVEWGEPVKKGKVPRRTKIGNVTFVPKHSPTSSQGLSRNLVITDVFACHNPIPPSASGKALPSCQHTHRGPWLALSAVHQLPRSPPVPCQNWPRIANASLLADHPPNASTGIYCVNQVPHSQFDVSLPAVCLSPSPSQGHVPLECEPILMLGKKKNRTQFLKLSFDMPSEMKLIFKWFPAVIIASCLDGSVITEARRAIWCHIWPDNRNCDWNSTWDT